MKNFEIKTGKIFYRNEEVTPDYSGTNGKVVQGTSANGLWFLGKTNTEKTFAIYKKDLLASTGCSLSEVHNLFLKYTSSKEGLL